MCSHKQTVGRNIDIKKAATECLDRNEEHSREYVVQMAFKDRERGHKSSWKNKANHFYLRAFIRNASL